MGKFKNTGKTALHFENDGKEVYIEVGHTRTLVENDYIEGLVAFGELTPVEAETEVVPKTEKPK